MEGLKSGNNDPWGWLGLLKWSLAYTDGTKPSDATTMSTEDKAFLETVMKEGIIDENARMQTILKEVTKQMEQWRKTQYRQEEADTVEELLQEVRDIVEQIDYARAFSAMKGVGFLLGCVQELESIPRSVHMVCLGLLATMCQHNPPVQKELLELGSIRILSELYFSIDDDEEGHFRARIMQAISANVRSHEMAESVFCELEQATQLIAQGLKDDSPLVLRKRTLFFLRALVSSDASTFARVRRFGVCVCMVVDSILLRGESPDPELVEISLQLVEEVLEQRKSVNSILARKNLLVAKGVHRISTMRSLTGDDYDFAAVELRLWEHIISLLARAEPDVQDEANSTITTQ